MNTPTDAQIKELWEWCGFRQKYPDAAYYEPSNWYMYPNGDTDKLPSIDLNNLFQWAVPKLRKYYTSLTESFLPEHYSHTIIPLLEQWIQDIEENLELDPALALFWAIWEVIHAGD